MTKTEQKNKSQSEVCPNCGYCPHCGRGQQQFLPYNPIPWNPTPSPWVYPQTVPSPFWTGSGTSLTIGDTTLRSGES